MQEIWKYIDGFENLYQISNYGKVKRISYYNKNRYYKEKIISQKKDSRGYYMQVTIGKRNKRKTLLVHRLVANAFIPNPSNYLEINHIDENKQNNNVNNLEWCDRKYNNTYGRLKNKWKGTNNICSKLNYNDVKFIREKYKNPYTSKELSNMFNVSQSHICHIISNNYWRVNE